MEKSGRLATYRSFRRASAPLVLLACDDPVESSAIQLAIELQLGTGVELCSVGDAEAIRDTLRPTVAVVSDTSVHAGRLPAECRVLMLTDRVEVPDSDGHAGGRTVLFRRPFSLDRLVGAVRLSVEQGAGLRVHGNREGEPCRE